MHKLIRSPETYTFDGADFEKHAAETAKNADLMEYLFGTADGYLDLENITVTRRKIRAASGDPHDYSSMGPYWWPDPNKENGLPYIRRDGEINPETRDDNDPGRLFTRVSVLTDAAYYSGKAEYAEKAVGMLKTWFIDPETRMNPNMRYAQSIPGICDGRGIGLIDTHYSFTLFDSISLLDAMGYISEDLMNGIKGWYGEFLDWMLTSEIGVDEDRQHNNHGAWYDVQVAVTALFLNRPKLANRTLSLSYERRTLKHIDSEGKQPYELARTNGLGYSIMNLMGLMILAELSPKANCKVDVWNAEGTPLKAALDYLRPYFESLEGFGYQQISGKIDRSGASRLLTIAEKHYPGNGYGEQAAKYVTDKMLWRVRPF